MKASIKLLLLALKTLNSRSKQGRFHSSSTVIVGVMLMIAAIPTIAEGQTFLRFRGTSSALPIPGQTGNINDAQVGESFLYPNIDGVGFDAILTINDLQFAAGSGTKRLELARNNQFVDLFGIPNTWMQGTVRFITSGSSTLSNPFGDAIVLQNVTQITASDIDSDLGSNYTDVFALRRSVAPDILGARVQVGGFVNDFGQPINGFSYVRGIADNDPAAENSLSWTNFPDASVDPPLSRFEATWSHANETIQSVNFVWGSTSNSSSTVFTRGMRLNLTFDGTAPVPEPSSAALLGLGGLALILYRRR